MPAFALTIFIGAFLLFQVQPLVGKYILPWFGGGPSVWTTCMLFFQLVLLAGYAYAHVLSRSLRLRSQAIVHLALVALALVALPIIPGDRWKPLGTENPTLQILSLLGVSLGVPYFVLSSTGPLMQQWFSQIKPSTSPYRLYALSNTGSLLALLTYPFYFEAQFTRKAQARLWGWGLVVYALCCAWCALKILRTSPGRFLPGSPGGVAAVTASEPVSTAGPESSSMPGCLAEAAPARGLQRFLWVALPACASILLLAVTNKMCQDVAVIPFLWVLPLALYLLSFIICFDSPRWYIRMPFLFALVAAVSCICWALFRGTNASLYSQVIIYSGGLFICCMVCHGELYRLRPDPSRLTSFYLLIAVGGAFGGIFAAALAPLIFHDYYELHWGLVLCAALFLAACLVEKSPEPAGDSGGTLESWRWPACLLPVIAFAGLDWFLRHVALETGSLSRRALLFWRLGLWSAFALLAVSWVARGKMKTFRHWRALASAWLLLGIGVLSAALWSQVRDTSNERVYSTRNFYGVLSVFEHRREEPDGHHFRLQHGRITHGLQFVNPELAHQPTTYYAESSGVGLAVRALPAEPRRIGVVGLGTGSMAVYGRTGDYLRIYEINPEVRKLATTRFRYVPDCPGLVEVAMGDARLSMERENPEQFDLLVLDAFSSDAIPVHLLTKEAFELYERHMKPKGIIAVHISNHYLDLEPVVANLARHFALKSAMIDFEETDEEWWLYSSCWILLTHDQATLDLPQIRSSMTPIKTKSSVPLWTDDFTSLFQILRK